MAHSTLLVIVEECRVFVTLCFNLTNVENACMFEESAYFLMLLTFCFTCGLGVTCRLIDSPNKARDNDSDHNVDFAAGNVKLITTKEAWDQYLEEARRDGKIVIANFSAAWCGPCKMIAPYYCELSEKYTSMMFLVVDVDELTDFSTSWDIKATPTFFFLKDGQQLDKLVGANKPELQKKIVAINDSLPEYKQ
ncbi:Thioredoxin H9 [Glycine soja]|uniref:Thioredoxin H9 n=1 Tax=Glycine soja TaxID=3848 RepID=A0A445FVX2_GLYSO|nr:Thioredoxin H9 [Glycine soja]